MRRAAIIALVAAIGCGGEQAGDGDCAPTDRSGISVDSAAVLGVGVPEFAAIDDGTTLELELGTQGGWMVRPLVQIDAASLGAGDGACVWVETTAAVDGLADPPRAMIEVPAFRYDDQIGVSAPLLVLLAFDLETVEGRDATLEVRVEGPAAGTTTLVDVTLVNAE